MSMRERWLEERFCGGGGGMLDLESDRNVSQGVRCNINGVQISTCIVPIDLFNMFRTCSSSL